jgi:hypothetical protein
MESMIENNNENYSINNEATKLNEHESNKKPDKNNDNSNNVIQDKKYSMEPVFEDKNKNENYAINNEAKK